MILLAALAGPSLAAPAQDALVPRMAPSPGLELQYSPARAGALRVSAWNAMIDDHQAYVRLDAGDRPIAEGIGHAPPLSLRAGDPRLGPMTRASRYTFHGLAPAVRLHLSYTAAGPEARAWVWATGGGGPRLHFEGRATRASLVPLVEWAWAREFRRLCGEMAYERHAARAARAAAKLPENYFR